MAGRHRSGGSPGWRLPVMIAAVVVVLLAVVGGIVAVTRQDSGGRSTLAQTQPSASATSGATTSPGDSPSPSPSPDPLPTVAQAHTVKPTAAPTASPTHSVSSHSTTTTPTLSITWTQRAWVRVTDVNAGVVVLAGSYLPGYAAHWNGGRYYVELGNSGGVRVSTNGGTPYTPGPVGQIRRFTVVRG